MILMGRSSLGSRSHLDFGWPSRSIAECHTPRYFEAGDLVFARTRLQNRTQSSILLFFSTSRPSAVRSGYTRAELSAAALPLDLHIGEKRHQWMGTHRNDCAGLEPALARHAPMKLATSELACSTVSRSSVSGLVKNCGA
jgi:hypothetical protein